MSHEPSTGSAERRANGDFVLPLGSFDQKQIGDVGAGDQKHEADRTHYDQQSPAHAADRLLGERNQPDATAAIAVRKLPRQLRRHAVHFGLCLFKREVRFEPADHLQISLSAIDVIRLEIHRHPKIGLAGGTLKTARHDTDDLKIFPFKLYLRAAHLRIRSELTSPQLIADDHDSRMTRGAFFSGKRSAERGWDTEQGEIVGRDDA